MLLTIVPFEVTGSTPTTLKSSSRAELFQERQITGAIFPEGPFLSDTDFAQAVGPHSTSCLTKSSGEVEASSRSNFKHEQMRHSESRE